MHYSKLLNLRARDSNLFRCLNQVIPGQAWDLRFEFSKCFLNLHRPAMIVCLLIIGIICPLRLQAQESNFEGALNRASRYILGEQDEILISVNIWGFVRKPGQYLVPRQTDLISLMSFAGGPIEGADLGKVRIIRDNAGYASPNGSNGSNGKNGEEGRRRSAIVYVDVQRFVETGTSSLIPPLGAGDTVLISQSAGNKFKNVLGFSSVVGILAAGASLVIILDRVAR